MELSSNFSTLIVDKKIKTSWRESIFLVTINLNKSYNSRDIKTLDRMPDINKQFEDLLHNLFDKRNLIKLFVDVGKPGSNERKFLNADNVKAIEANTQKEVNEEGRGFLHAHTVIKIVHNTRVLINLPLLRKVVQKKMQDVLTFDGQYKSPFVGVKAKGTTYNIENYVK